MKLIIALYLALVFTAGVVIYQDITIAKQKRIIRALTRW